MNRKKKVEFTFKAEDGTEIRVIGFLIESAYEEYFELIEAYLVADPTQFLDESDFLEEDLERLAKEAEEFLESDSLYRGEE